MKEFVTEKEWKNGEFNCKIIFTQLGHRCGYVGVPKGHPMFGRDYNKCIEDIDCHGGLTYSGFRDDNSKEYWYFGFDCAHADDGVDIESLKKYGFDISPFLSMFLPIVELWEPNESSQFKTKEFCEEQCNSIAEQIKQIYFSRIKKN